MPETTLGSGIFVETNTTGEAKEYYLHPAACKQSTLPYGLAPIQKVGVNGLLSGRITGWSS